LFEGPCLFAFLFLRIYVIFKTTSAPLSANDYPGSHAFSSVNDECADVDEFILELADYKNDYADVAAEKLLRKCSTSWDAYQYLRDRMHEPWLPDGARQQLRRIVKQIQVRLHQSREYGWAYEQS
jgi:flagellar biosynthesis chaperone FliJ